MSERENSESSFGAFLAGFIIGGLVGAAVALVLAPQSGEDTRTQLAERSAEWRDLVNENRQNLTNNLNQAGSSASDIIGGIDLTKMTGRSTDSTGEDD
ncbi:MAG: YtxH domain-containing protein [Chloroflexota bacterium]